VISRDTQGDISETWTEESRGCAHHELPIGCGGLGIIGFDEAPKIDPRSNFLPGLNKLGKVVVCLVLIGLAPSAVRV
jgi:hypothetical protein